MTNQIGLYLSNGGAEDNPAGHVLDGTSFGILGGGAIQITNEGSITGTASSGIATIGTGSVTNNAIITGATGISIDQAGKVTNAGTIEGTTGAAISIAEGGGVSNATEGVIAGIDTGVEIDGAPGTIGNHGTITASGSLGLGAYLGLGGTIDNTAGATISGTEFGVLAGGSASTTIIQNSGTISGNTGIAIEGAAAIVDAGVIKSTAAFNGVAVQFESAGSTLVVARGGTLVGSIEGFGTGDILELWTGGVVINGETISSMISNQGFGTTVTLTHNGTAVTSVRFANTSFSDPFVFTAIPGSQYFAMTIGNVPTTVSAAMFEADEALLNLTAGGVTIADTAANIQSNLKQIQADAGHIASIRSTYGRVTVGVGTFVSNGSLLDKIRGGFNVTDDAVAIESHIGALEENVGGVDAIHVASGIVSVPITTFDVDKSALSKIVGGFQVTDTAAHIQSAFDALEGDVAEIRSVIFSGPSTPILNLTAAQAGHDASLIAKIASRYVLNVADANGSTTTTGYGNDLTFMALKAGRDTITGGGTSETFVFGADFHLDTIADFYKHLTGSMHDTISLPKVEFSDFAAVLHDAISTSAGTTITAPGNRDQLVLPHVTADAFAKAQGDFKFV